MRHVQVVGCPPLLPPRAFHFHIAFFSSQDTDINSGGSSVARARNHAVDVTAKASPASITPCTGEEGLHLPSRLNHFGH